MVSTSTTPIRTVNPPNVPNQMGKEWYLNVKQSIEEAMLAGACKKMDFAYTNQGLYFLERGTFGANTSGRYEKALPDSEGISGMAICGQKIDMIS